MDMLSIFESNIWWSQFPPFIYLTVGIQTQHLRANNKCWISAVWKEREKMDTAAGVAMKGKVSAGCNETDVSGCHNWVKEMGNRLWRAWLKGGSVTKSQRLNASASSFRSPEMWDRSNSIPDMVHNNVNRSRKWFKGIVVEKSLFPPASAPVLSVKDGILKGKRNPGELRLKMNKIAICANVSKWGNAFLHVFCHRDIQFGKLLKFKFFAKPNLSSRRKADESSNLANIFGCHSVGCTFTHPKCFRS